MAHYSFVVPPMPHYLYGGEDVYTIGQEHMARHSIGVYDLLIVRSGCLHMGEGEERWEVRAGEMLLLAPDAYHYATRPCDEETAFYWLHFTIPSDKEVEDYSAENGFCLELDSWRQLEQPQIVYQWIGQLFKLEQRADAAARWQQQQQFQQILQHITRESGAEPGKQIQDLAEQTATYLRMHFRENVTYDMLSAHLRYHPVHIARSMKRVFGCTPQSYLQRYRVDQAKKLLLSTSLSIGAVAEESGYSHFSYFSKQFAHVTGMTPRAYRKQFMADSQS